MNAPPKSLEPITPSQGIISQNNGLINIKRVLCGGTPRRHPHSLDFSNPAGGLSPSTQFCQEMFLPLLFLYFSQSQHQP